jgi:maltoporin
LLRFRAASAVVTASVLLVGGGSAWAQPKGDAAPEPPAAKPAEAEAPPAKADAPPSKPAPAPPAKVEPPSSSGTGAAKPEVSDKGEESVPPADKHALPDVAKPLRDLGFQFGSYGRMIAATDGHGGPGRDANIVAHGSRLDEGNYVELELRRDDYWQKTGATTRLVATLALANPVFHYNGDFNVKMAVRNLYMEERGLGADGLSVWVGSRMYRGDDVYLLDFWPLDNLNTVGGGIRYDASQGTSVAVHAGLSQPANDFYLQQVQRAMPLNQPGAASVSILDRQRFIGSVKIQHVQKLGADGAGIKAALYAELHELPSGQRQTQAEIYEDVPADSGWVAGAQLGAFSGKRDTHVNLFLRYARGLAAYGEFDRPSDLAIDKSTSGAHELLAAVGGNWEYGPVGVMLGGYVRSFRDASPGLDYGDVDEGIIIARPAVFFTEWLGLAVEGSYQAQKRGVLLPPTSADGATQSPNGPLTARLYRVGIMPFLSPAGRGDYSRPQIRLIWAVTLRDDAARSLYPQDDPFSLRSTEYFFGLGAEWWFNSSSYGG